MEKQGVPMNHYPQQTPSPSQQQQPPVYAQDPNTSPPPQLYSPGPNDMYAQHPHSPPPQVYPQQQQPAYPQYQQQQQQQQGPYMEAQQKSGGEMYTQTPSMPGMPPQQQQQQQQQAGGAANRQYQNATPVANLNRGPAPADCPACGQRAMTNVMYETGNTTHAWALGLCCLVCLGCIPYAMNSMKDVQHKCGRCGVLLATWHRSGTTEVHIHT